MTHAFHNIMGAQRYRSDRGRSICSNYLIAYCESFLAHVESVAVQRLNILITERDDFSFCCNVNEAECCTKVKSTQGKISLIFRQFLGWYQRNPSKRLGCYVTRGEFKKKKKKKKTVSVPIQVKLKLNSKEQNILKK